jgi:hypothetical protein
MANKNAYEIRTEILSMALDIAGREAESGQVKWHYLSERDEAYAKTNPFPTVTGTSRVLKIAEELYSFVNK